MKPVLQTGTKHGTVMIGIFTRIKDLNKNIKIQNLESKWIWRKT
jgi:hypothetical protein